MEKSFDSLCNVMFYIKNLGDNCEEYAKLTSTKSFGDEGSVIIRYDTIEEINVDSKAEYTA